MDLSFGMKMAESTDVRGESGCALSSKYSMVQVSSSTRLSMGSKATLW